MDLLIAMAAATSVCFMSGRIAMIELLADTKKQGSADQKTTDEIEPEFERCLPEKVSRSEGCYAQPYDGSCFFERKL
jgi:hypothetical protein